MYNSNDFPQIKFLKKNKKKNSSNFKKPIYLLAPIFLSGLIFSNYDSKPVEVKEKKPNIEIVKNNTTPVELVVKRIVKKDENLSKLLNQNKILEAKITNYENRFSSLEKRLENAEGIIGKPMLNATTLMDINFDGYLDEVVPYSGGSVRVDFKDNLGKKIL